MKKVILGIATLLIIALITFIYFTKKERDQLALNKETALESAYTEIIIKKDFGIIPADSFKVETRRIRWSENFNKIFRRYHISGDVREILNKKISDVFDVRKIKAQNYYKVYRKKNEIPEFLVYKHSTTEYLIVNIKAQKAEFRTKKTVIKHRISEGTIASSLWNTMVDNDINPELSIELSEIYAWTIDFFGLQKGDHFRVVYDEKFIDDTISIGIENIQSVVFNHMGDNYFAFGYEQNGVFDYWDEKGNSLRKAFLKAPLKFARISSKFSKRRFHPILKIYRPHSGVDYAAPKGTPVYSIGDGVITKKGYGKGAGNYVYIKHNSVYTTQYNHFSRFAKGIRRGQRVKQGQLIGYVGATGYATGPHLDFRMYKNGQAVDPLKVKAPPVKPIEKENLKAFFQVRDLYINDLVVFQKRSYSLPEGNLLYK